MSANLCVCCGAVVPEGRQVCPVCDVTGPIEVIKGKVRESFENGVLTVLQDIDIKVDKARLIRALELDKKLRAGELVEVVRCNDCRFWGGWEGCKSDHGLRTTSNECFCYFGKRKEITDE